MLKDERNKMIQYFMSECANSDIPFHISEADIEDQKVVKGKKKDKGKKYTIPAVPTAAELLGKDPDELNPPSADPMNDLPGDVPPPPEFEPTAQPSPADAPPEEPAEADPTEMPPEEPAPAEEPAEIDPSEMPPEDPNVTPADPNATPIDPNAAPPSPDVMPPADPNAMPPADPNAMGGMPGDPNAMPGDPNAMGMPPEEEPLDPTQIGQVYILKKIYARLLSVDDNINQLSSPDCDELKERCTEAIELFQSVVTNFDQFKDKLDDIIKLFQKLLTNFVKKLEILVPKGDESNE